MLVLILPADLDATYHPDLRQNVFVKEEYHFLNVSGIGIVFEKMLRVVVSGAHLRVN